MPNGATDVNTLISNPYHFLPAGPAEFVGRWSPINRLVTDLAVGQSSHGLVGGRRIGKTSVLTILRYLLDHDERFKNRALPLLIDSMLTTYISPDHFWGSLLGQLRQRVDSRLSSGTNKSEFVRVDLANTGIDAVLTLTPPQATAEHFGAIIDTVLKQLEDAGGPRRLVLLLDEMDSLLDYPWHTQLFSQQRASIVSGPAKDRLRLVLAGSRRFVDEATNRGSPLHNVLQLHYLTALDELSIDQLASRTPLFPESIHHAVWQQSGGHPFLATYLLYHLWELATDQPSQDTVTDLADLFIQQEATHLTGWSKAIGLSGIQIYGLFIDLTDNDWLARTTIVQQVANPQIDVTQAINALCYHGLITPNATWSQFRRSGRLFYRWYTEELSRLLAELTPKDALPSQPAFWRPDFVLHLTQAINTGSGAIAQGRHTIAAGERGAAVQGDVHESPIVTGNDNAVQQPKDCNIAQVCESDASQTIADQPKV